MPEATPLSIALAARGQNRDWLARQSGCSSAYAGDIVRGRRQPAPDLARRIAKALELDVDDLFADPQPDTVIVQFVRRTTTASNVPEKLEDVAVAGKVAGLLRGAQ